MIAVLTAGALLGGCGTTEKTADSGDAKEIKIGATAGPHAEVAEEVAKEAAKQGIKIKVVEFSDYLTPDKALAEGQLDLNSYQHEPFLKNFIEQNNADLTAIGTTVLMRMGIYSNKYHDLKDIPDNAVIAVPNDPTNGGRGLLLLEKAGLLKLKDGAGFKATATDIADNPKHLQIKELEAAQLPRSLDDVDAAAVPMNYAMSGGLDVKQQGIFFEDKNGPLTVIVLAARTADKDNPTYKKIAEIFHSPELKQFIENKYKGTIEPAE